MGLFFHKDKEKITRDTKCYNCGRRIKPTDKYVIIDGEVYCEECIDDALLWEEEMMDLLDDM